MKTAYQLNRGLHHQRVEKLFAADGGRCCWCSKELVVGGPVTNDARATVEHLVTRSAGGPDWQENLTLACRPCNSSRRSMAAARFARRCAARGADVRTDLLLDRLKTFAEFADTAGYENAAAVARHQLAPLGDLHVELEHRRRVSEALAAEGVRARDVAVTDMWRPVADLALTWHPVLCDCRPRPDANHELVTAKLPGPGGGRKRIRAAVASWCPHCLAARVTGLHEFVSDADVGRLGRVLRD